MDKLTNMKIAILVIIIALLSLTVKKDCPCKLQCRYYLKGRLVKMIESEKGFSVGSGTGENLNYDSVVIVKKIFVTNTNESK